METTVPSAMGKVHTSPADIDVPQRSCFISITSMGPILFVSLTWSFDAGLTQKSFSPKQRKSLNELWLDFQKTPAFTPIAALANEIYAELGCSNESPSRHVERRFEVHLRSHYDQTRIEQIHKELGYVKGQPPANLVARYALLLFMKEPGGLLTAGALDFLVALARAGTLPGFDDVTHRQNRMFVTAIMLESGFSNIYPAKRTFFCNLDALLCRNHFTVMKETPSDDWKLMSVWRTGSDGKVNRYYPVK